MENQKSEENVFHLFLYNAKLMILGLSAYFCLFSIILDKF